MPLDDFTDITDDGGGDTGESVTDVDLDIEETSDDSGITFEETPTTPDGEETGIGILSVAEGLRIDETGDDTVLRAYITAENRSSIRVGSYLLVPYPDGERLFCRIGALEYAQEFHSDDATELQARRAMREDGIKEADYKFIAELTPVAVLYAEDGELKRRMTDRVPKPKTSVRAATDDTEIKTGLKIPESGVFLGHLAVGGQPVTTAAEPPRIDYRLKDTYAAGDPLVFRHTLIAGGTGSGKTHAAKNVLRQLLAEEHTYALPDGRDRRPAVVQFDPQDEYAQMHDDNPEVTDADRRAWERADIAYGGHDDTIAFVPKIAGASYNGGEHRAEQIEFTVPFSMVQDNQWLVAGSGLNDKQYQALRELLDRFFDQYGDEGTYEQFVSFIEDPALKTELDETGRIHEKTFEAVGRRIRGFGSIFDQDAVPITEQVRKVVSPGRLSVIPTYHISSTRAAETVVLAVASLLVDQKLSSDPTYDRIKETPLIVGMDEAHNYLTDAETVQARRVIGKFTDAAKQGRKERLGLFLITQDPQDIHDAVFKQLNTTVVLNLGDEDAIDSVNIPAELEGKVPYMEQGQMVVYSPDNSEPVELVGLPKCVTRHG